MHILELYFSLLILSLNRNRELVNSFSQRYFNLRKNGLKLYNKSRKWTLSSGSEYIVDWSRDDASVINRARNTMSPRLNPAA